MVATYYSILNFFWSIYDSIRNLLLGTRTYDILVVFGGLVTHLWYYAFIGAFAAVTVSHILPKERVRRFLEGNRGLAILFATFLGILSPMCTFSAIPLVAGLMAMGLPAPPLIAFLISSPLMNPSLFFITWGVMGPEMALARTISALLLGLIGGGLAELLAVRKVIDFSHSVDAEFVSTRRHPLIAGGSPITQWEELKGFVRQLRKMSLFISKYFFLSLLLAAAVQVLISPHWIGALFGGRGFSSALMGGLLGIPLYACGGGTVATIAVLVAMGMGQGAALAFFLTGPATKISTILTLNAVMKRKIMWLYLCVTIIGGVLLGYVYSTVAPPLKIDEMYYGQVESTEDGVMVKRGVTPARLW